MRTSVISHPLLLSLWKMSHFPGHKEAFYCLNRLSFLNAYFCIPKKKILKAKVTRVKWSTCKMQHLSTVDDHGVETNLFRMLVFRSIRSWNDHTDTQTHTCLRTSTCGTAIVLAQLFCFDGGRQKSERTSQSDWFYMSRWSTICSRAPAGVMTVHMGAAQGRLQAGICLKLQLSFFVNVKPCPWKLCFG